MDPQFGELNSKSLVTVRLFEDFAPLIWWDPKETHVNVRVFEDVGPPFGKPNGKSLVNERCFDDVTPLIWWSPQGLLNKCKDFWGFGALI